MAGKYFLVRSLLEKISEMYLPFEQFGVITRKVQG